MSGTEETFAGKLKEVAGKAKQAFGEATHNDKLANEGAADQVKGHAEEAWGSVKDAASEKKAEHDAAAEDKSHDIREKIVSTAQNVKEHIQSGVDSYRNDHK